MGAAVIVVVAASMTFSYRILETVSNSLTFSYSTFAVVADNITAIYFREDPTAIYIPCGFCVTYRAIDPSFLAFHMLEYHESELLNAPAVSHNSVSSWYDL